MVEAQPDDPGAGGIDLRDLLPDDAPPWLVALVAVLAFLLATSVMWGPALNAYLRALVPHRRTEEGEPDPSDTDPHPSSVPVRAPAADRVDAGMAVIQRMVDDQAEHVRSLMAEAEAREADLREQIRQNGELRIMLAGAEGRIATLQGYLDRLLEDRARRDGA